ncbi:Lutropin-choriogonadotropic hormone receptor [Chionoecetes opilio]|uniref:Lutropin-choriogonadotropic hormone receptor n=1 Tax=Chionoecetes opilio TaxID=41210 RepID=A0A8J8WCB8_CHIOP|nr:Lutropin-choriogonadotropic hormone receptor [Chionoecetes opilio]
MTRRNFPFPHATSPSSIRTLFSLLLVVLCCCAPVAPASSLGRQGPDGDVGQLGVLSSMWRQGLSPHPLKTDEAKVPERGGEVAGARVWGPDGALNRDHNDAQALPSQRRRHLYKGEYPVSRKTAHRSRGSVNIDDHASENSKRSSSSYFVSSDRNSPGRKEQKDIRPGNWPQEVEGFERALGGDESKRKASQSQHKSSITRGRGEGRQPARGSEILSRHGRQVLEDSILASNQLDPPPDSHMARAAFDTTDISDHAGAPLEEPMTALGPDVEPDIDDGFHAPVDSITNSERIPPSINPEAFPLREQQWHSGRGTMPLEAPQTGFSDSWGTDAYGDSLEPGFEDRTPYDLEEVLAREEAALEAHTLMVLQPALEDPGCGCWETDTPKSYWECSCWNCDLLQVPTNFSGPVSIITLTNVGLKTIRNDSFTRYRETLSDLVLDKVEELSAIEAGAFKGLSRLRSIYIHSAPQLKSMPNLTFNEDNNNLIIFRITNSGLEEIPFIENTASGNIIHMIEMDTNRIRKVRSRSLHVMVDLLSLNYNLIEEVEREAFAGSQIAKLSLKGNSRLRSLHDDAFKGIGSLRTLDLSETSITSLPTVGLTNLEVLILERTPSLKVFPSVYSFKNIEKAHLTYPYHCCAFQFPQQHDPRQHMETMRKMEQRCSDVTSPNPLLLVPTTRPRRRRFKSAHTTAPSPEESRPMGNTYEEDPPDYTPDQGSPGERWGGLSQDEGWGAVSLSSPSSDDELVAKTKRHGRNRQYERLKSSPENTAGKLHVSISHPRRKELLETITDAASSSQPRPHARHSGHHTRLLKPHNEPNTQGGEASGHASVKQEGRFRRGSHTQPEPRVARASRSLDGGKVALRFESHSGHQAAALIREPEEIIPRPEKRDSENDRLSFHSDSSNKEFVGGGTGSTFPIPLGFGSFNHTHHKVLPSILPKANTSTQGWETHVWSEAAPPLDSGDEATYFINHAAHPGESHKDEVVGGTFHTGVFNSESVGEVWHRGHEDGATKHSSKWLPGQVNISSKNTTIYISCGNLSKDYHDVQCEPGPDAFNPCEDIMGNLALRVAVWVVVVTAVVGNLAVMIVLISSKFKRSTLRNIEQKIAARNRSSRPVPTATYVPSCKPFSRMTVSKFLMVNLALADLCMGLYLLIIAAMDLHTIGVYFNYAIDWQNGPGCKVAGFLTVFASELSIFTLTVITSERWYAITYAIHLNKRLKLSMAVKIMVGGWTYSIAMAILPLVGVSSYSKTSICLPMETGDGLSLAYLVSLLLVNGLAFFVITACYISMYFSISRHDATTEHSDLTVAKRMALLVFTDFACWAPIAFFGLTAVAGLPLINVTRAKILLVFFYPLNSCANPYLYAILTKQYRRDLFILLARYGFCTKRAMKYKGAYSSVNNTFPHNTVVNAPNHRSSTLTQITLCDLSRTRASQQSNNGSLLGGTIVGGGGSQDSLQRNVSPIRTPTKAETSCGCQAAENDRLSTVQEMSHSNPSDEELQTIAIPQVVTTTPTAG